MKKFKVFAVLLVSLPFIQSCTKTQGVPLEEIIRLELFNNEVPVVDNTLTADGKTQVKIIVSLPKETSEAYKTVKIKTSAGTFNVSQADKTEQTVYAVSSEKGDKLIATAILTLGISSGKYTVSAQVSAKPDYKTESTFQTLPTNTAESISLEIEDYDKLVEERKLKSDGLTRIKLIASVPLRSSDEERLIEFKSSAGTFDVTGESKNSKQVTASLQRSTDTELKAFAYLTLGTQSGEYTISSHLVSAQGVSSEKVIRVLPIANSEIINLTVTPETGLRANGTDLVKILLSLSNTPSKKLILTASDGTFLNSADPKTNELEVNSEGKAEIFLRIGTDVKDYLLTAKLSGSAVAITKTLTPLRAHAERILIEPSSLSIIPGGASIKLDVFLKRESDKVSTGSVVSVKSYQTNNGEVHLAGRITGKNNVSDVEGKISMEFFADSTPLIADKPIFIEVSTLKDDGGTVTEKLEITLKKE